MRPAHEIIVVYEGSSLASKVASPSGKLFLDHVAYPSCNTGPKVPKEPKKSSLTTLTGTGKVARELSLSLSRTSEEVLGGE